MLEIKITLEDLGGFNMSTGIKMNITDSNENERMIGAVLTVAIQAAMEEGKGRDFLQENYDDQIREELHDINIKYTRGSIAKSHPGFNESLTPSKFRDMVLNDEMPQEFIDLMTSSLGKSLDEIKEDLRNPEVANGLQELDDHLDEIMNMIKRRGKMISDDDLNDILHGGHKSKSGFKGDKI